MKKNKATFIYILIVIMCIICYTLYLFILSPNEKIVKDEKLVVKDNQFVIKKISIKDSITPLRKIKANKYEDIENYSEIATNIVVYRSGDTLEISSVGLLIENLLGFDNSSKGLESSLGLKLKIEPQIYSNGIDSLITEKVSYKNSTIIVHDNPELGNYIIVYANIVNKEFLLLDGIHVGMTKKEFLDKIFGKQMNYDYSDIKVVISADDRGELYEYFIFRSDLLQQIIIRSSYDWIIPN